MPKKYAEWPDTKQKSRRKKHQKKSRQTPGLAEHIYPRRLIETEKKKLIEAEKERIREDIRRIALKELMEELKERPTR